MNPLQQHQADQLRTLINRPFFPQQVERIRQGYAMRISCAAGPNDQTVWALTQEDAETVLHEKYPDLLCTIHFKVMVIFSERMKIQN